MSLRRRKKGLGYERLLAIFQMLGCEDAELLARLEREENTPQLARLLFLRAMWAYVLEDEHDWARTARDTRSYRGGWYYPNPHVARAVKRMLARGVDPRDLSDVVRDAQIIALYNVSQLLDDASYGIEEIQAKIPENVEWRLVEYDGENETIGRLIQGLHEGFHSADPTGREGNAPRERKRAQRRGKNTARKRARPSRRQ